MNGNVIFLIAMGAIWIMLLYHMVLSLGGYLYSEKLERAKSNVRLQRHTWPKVSILIPAHNEERVIDKTIQAMLMLDYPEDSLEIIVINDLSSDKTGSMIDAYASKYPQVIAVHTTKSLGGRGKSAALNYGMTYASGEYIAVYDADNRPERLALKYLVSGILTQGNIGAVVGKFRVINASKNLLTRFINIETISYQWMAQAGLWHWFKISTIPGTNFLIRRSLLQHIGGWDEQALAEDTELSIRIYEAGYEIHFLPLAITWEQEPETWKVWLKQRTRWARGNQYVIVKYMRFLMKLKRKRMFLDILYFFFTYFLFLGGVILSHVLFICGLFGVLPVTIPGPFILIWVLAYVLYVIEIMITLAIEKTELTVKNFLIVLLMYLSYSQLWLFLVVRALGLQLKDAVTKKEVKWEKTQRFGQ